MAPKTFVVPLDGSTFAERALPIAAAMADRIGGGLLLVSAQYCGPLRPREYLEQQAAGYDRCPVELIETKAIASGHRADFERECERTNKLLAELLKSTSESIGAREKAALLEGKLSMLTQPWRRRLVDAFTLALPQVAGNARENAGSVAQSRN